mgnify:CR=1 FL=1
MSAWTIPASALEQQRIFEGPNWNFLCLEAASVDILYISEIDPLWQDSELTAIINPEAVLFVDDGQAQAGEIDALLDQCVGADHQLRLGGSRRQRAEGRQPD